MIRTPKNLGFVGSCNLAAETLPSDSDLLLLNSDTRVTAGFLEEMSECLYAGDRHGVACPRSNAASLSTLPLRASSELSADQRFECWKKIKDHLPRFSVIPTGVGFCMLIKGDLVRRFGLFDPAYGRGYNEENDFCMRISRYGYSSILVNRAFAFHDSGQSFTAAERTKLDIRNRATLLKRYPEYSRIVRDYFERIPAHERFADILGSSYVRRKMAIDLSRLVAAYNGTSEYALSLLKHLHPLLSKTSDVSILADPAVDAFFGLSTMYPRVLDYRNDLNERFDVAFSPMQVVSLHHLSLLNRIAVRWVINMQDIIVLRCRYLSGTEEEVALRTAAKFADGILSVSETSLKDFETFIGGGLNGKGIRGAILHGLPEVKNVEGKSKDSNTSFVLLIGNDFDHKAVSLAGLHLPSGERVVILGGKKHRVLSSKKVTVHESGQLSSDFVEDLYRNASAILFPTQYEGFGLPILRAAAYQKPVVCPYMQPFHELKEKYGLSNLILFKNFEQIPAALAQAKQMKCYPPSHPRNWADAANETAAFIEDVLQKPADIAALDERSSLIDCFEYYRREPDGGRYARQIIKGVRAIIRFLKICKAKIGV